MREAPSGSDRSAAWSPWRVVVGFGTISLAADMVHEGARSVYGPLLLGGSAVVVGAVTGAGEAAALRGRSATRTGLPKRSATSPTTKHATQTRWYG